MAKAGGSVSYQRNRGINTTGGTSGPDAARQAQSDEIYRAAQGAGNAPLPTGVTDAQGFYGRGTAAGQQGIDALSGNAAAQQQFMNPYQQQVIDRMNTQFGVQNQNTMNQIGDQATQARAFGGSRQGVATGVALGENQRNQNMQVAGLLNQGFDNSMNRAGQVAGLGFDSAGAGANLGMTAGNRDIWRMNMLQRGVANQPWGTTNRQRTDTRQSQLGGRFSTSVGF